ncbi:MAG: DUF4190 domain-containing protein [Dermatophilaceae bacterium]
MSYGTPPPPPPPPPPGGYGAPPPPNDGSGSPYGGYTGQPAPPPQQGYGAPGPYGGAPARNNNALVSLICGIAGFLCFGIVLGPIAIITGRKAQAEIAASGGRQSGEGMAKAGVILGIVALVLWVIGLVLRLSGALN